MSKKAIREANKKQVDQYTDWSEYVREDNRKLNHNHRNDRKAKQAARYGQRD